MAKLLHIESSPRKERSSSTEVARALAEAYQQSNAADSVETWDLWGEALPEFNNEVLNAKYRIMHGQEHTPEEAHAWQAVVDIFNRFNGADKYVLSIPMWNFGIPYKLKHFIDLIAQPGLSFSYNPGKGYAGLVTGKPIAVVYSRGGEYSSSDQLAAIDLQRKYTEHLLGFLGFTDIHTILVEPTAAAPEAAEEAKNRALDEARRVGRAL